MEIVGVCKNARYGGLKRDIPPVIYIPFHCCPGPEFLNPAKGMRARQLVKVFRFFDLNLSGFVAGVRAF
jgi:hypothetical protein